MRTVPPLDIRYLETVLDVLPEPSSVEIGVAGNVFGGFSEFYKLLGDVLGFPNRLGYAHGSSPVGTYTISNATKEEVKGLLRDQAKRLEETRSDPRKSPYPVLHKVRWDLGDNKVVIELTPWEINIDYSGEEPTYVAELRRRLEDLHPVSKIEIR